MTKILKSVAHGHRVFTPAQWLKRDLRGAATKSTKDMKSGKRPITLPKLSIQKE